MSTQMLTLTSISIYMLGMLVIGYFAYKRTSNLTDYMLGGRTLGPAVTALSAGASDMSGWLLMGLPGAMFSVGLSSSWIAIGLTLGAYANWLYVAPSLTYLLRNCKQLYYYPRIFGTPIPRQIPYATLSIWTCYYDFLYFLCSFRISFRRCII